MHQHPGLRTRTAIAGSVVLVVWAIAGAIRIAQPPPGLIDRGWDAFAAADGHPVVHTIAWAFAVIGTGWPVFAILVVVATFLGVTRGWTWALFTVVASVVSELDVLGLKALALRVRPDEAFGVGNSFPSGHTANAALLGTVVILLVRHIAIRIPVVAYMLAMAWSRTALHAHWLTDVLGGLLVGAATAVLLHGVWMLLLARRADRRRAPHPARAMP